MDKKNNVILDLNPLTSISMIVFLSLTSALFGIKYVMVILILLIFIAMLAGVLSDYMKTWIKTIVFLSLIVFVLQALLIPGEIEAYNLFGISIKQEALDRAIPICSRILGIASPIVLATKIIDSNMLAVALEQKGISTTATYVVLSALNMIPQMGKKMNTIMDAQRSRGIETEGNVIIRAKAFLPVIGAMILNSIVGVEEKAITLEARGFSSTCNKTRLYKIKNTRSDIILMRLFEILCVLAIIWRIILWVL